VTCLINYLFIYILLEVFIKDSGYGLFQLAVLRGVTLHIVTSVGTNVSKNIKKKVQFLPYGRSIGSWICLTHKTYTRHTVQNTIRYGIR
jgi:hypothetical protein